jgi:hypothetical protein
MEENAGCAEKRMIEAPRKKSRKRKKERRLQAGTQRVAQTEREERRGLGHKVHGSRDSTAVEISIGRVICFDGHRGLREGS